MRASYAWGGEPEILMLTHVLASPIGVWMDSTAGLKRIARYGEDEYASEPQFDLDVLFHGGGHYEALRVIEGE